MPNTEMRKWSNISKRQTNIWGPSVDVGRDKLDQARARIQCPQTVPAVDGIKAETKKPGRELE